MEWLKIVLQWLLDIVNSKAFAPLAGVVVGFLLSQWKEQRNDYRTKRKNSKLAAAVIEALIEEVSNGYKLLLDAKEKGTIQHLLPSNTWTGTETISDDVLLRIITVSEGVQNRGFPPSQIRIHSKNYFVNIVGQVNAAVQGKRSLLPFFTGPGHKFDEATKGVLDMLQQTKELLEENAKKRKPR